MLERRAALAELTRTRLREMFREPEILFWVFAFPLLMAFGLGFAFRDRPPERVPIGVVESPEAAGAAAHLNESPALSARVFSEKAGLEQLTTGRISLLIRTGDPIVYHFDPTRPESRIARLESDIQLQRAAGALPAVATHEEIVREPGSRYIDFLLPGLIGMNLMGTGIWGIGFSIVTARTRKLLKRLAATPMRRSDYLLAQILARLVFLVAEVALLLGFGMWAFGVPLRGDFASLSLTCLLGSMTFAGLGLLVASRAQTIEAVSGLMNAVMLPMWICSGVFFSAERFPSVVQPLVQALPLTALIDALREIMLEGGDLFSTLDEQLILAVWAVVTFLLALKWFRWK